MAGLSRIGVVLIEAPDQNQSLAVFSCRNELLWPMNFLALQPSMSYLALMNDLLRQYAERLGRLLTERQAKVTTAESCTGGGIAEAITRISGSSAWFDCGFITYSNQAKSQLLAVPAALIAEHGAVSETVVMAMVQGAIAQVGVEFGVAVSGIAGPTGGSENKPVGTVWLAWAGPQGAHARRFLFAGDRAEVRFQAVTEALRGLIESVENAG